MDATIKNKALVLIQEGRKLLICKFETDHNDADYDFIEDVMFHFEQRVSEPIRHAELIVNDYFKSSTDNHEIKYIINLTEE